MPNLLWPFLEQIMDSTNYENREMAAKPELNIETYDEYSDKFESYYNDNLPFKNSLASLNSRIYYNIFHSSVDERVIIGKNGWLFYNSVRDGDPIGDYQGTRMLTDEQLKKITDNLTKAEEILAWGGVEFVLFILPNKERVYSEYMPDFYGEPAESCAINQLVDYLRANTDIRIVYPYEELMKAKEEVSGNILYHKSDTHWNNLGAYVGAQVLLKELGIDIPEITNSKLTISPIENTHADLAKMINLYGDIVDKESNYEIVGYDTHDMVNEKWDFYSEIIYHSQNADSRKLYVYRDSFCNAISDYLGSQFDNSYMILNSEYSYENLIEQEPDIFVLEVVERYADILTQFQLDKEKG